MSKMMKKKSSAFFFSIIFLVINFVFITCFSISNYENKKTSHNAGEDAPTVTDIWTTNPKNIFCIVGPDPFPGDPVTVIFVPEIADGKSRMPESPLRASLYNDAGKRITRAPFFNWSLSENNDGTKIVQAALFVVPSTMEAGNALLKMEAGGNNYADLPLTILPRDFAAETIPLNAANTSIRTEADPKKTEQAQRLWAILETQGTDIYSTGPFTPPVAADTRRTSFFGDRRVYKYSTGKMDTAIHAGIDYGVPKGTPVAACAAGKVVLASERITTGNSVILEHAPGLYSIYYHLDKITAVENTIVESGALLGLSGSTGLATGPHLHWEIRTATENTNPDTMCARPFLDKTAALAAILNFQ